MKAMPVVMKILTYPHHLKNLQDSLQSPVQDMHPLIQTQSCHAAHVSKNKTADWYADA